MYMVLYTVYWHLGGIWLNIVVSNFGWKIGDFSALKCRGILLNKTSENLPLREIDRKKRVSTLKLTLFLF